MAPPLSTELYTQILSELPWYARSAASLVCRLWHNILKSEHFKKTVSIDGPFPNTRDGADKFYFHRTSQVRYAVHVSKVYHGDLDVIIRNTGVCPSTAWPRHRSPLEVNFLTKHRFLSDVSHGLSFKLRNAVCSKGTNGRCIMEYPMAEVSILCQEMFCIDPEIEILEYQKSRPAKTNGQDSGVSPYTYWNDPLCISMDGRPLGPGELEAHFHFQDRTGRDTIVQAPRHFSSIRFPITKPYVTIGEYFDLIYKVLQEQGLDGFRSYHEIIEAAGT